MPTNAASNMMESYFNSDPNNFEETPFHLITTNHPYMATLGLSQFTTGTLYRWWNQKNAQGEYVNHKYFAENPDDIADKTHPILLLFGSETGDFVDKDDKGVNQFSFQAWRKEGDSGAGKYVTKYIDGGHTNTWNFVQTGLNEAGKQRSYEYSQLNLEEYNDVFLERDPSDSANLLSKNEFEIPDGKGKTSKVEFKGIDPITNVIALNDYVNNLESQSITRADWTDEQFARSEFILDIQTAKAQGGGLGYIEWSGYVPFYISLAKGESGDTFKCEKFDWVKYRLYLYPESAPKSSRRGVAIAKPTFAAPPVDSLGRKYQYREDGRFAAFPEGSQAAEVVGELDMTYNEYTGKWEAGSKQMVGIVTQTIPRAQILSAQRLRNLPPEEMLKNPSDPNSHIIFGSGLAMPLSMQNGNPMQWTPNYAQASETDADGKFTVICPKESQAKASLRVFNASAKEIKTDQMVLLNQIDGLWFCLDFPSGIEGAAVQPGFDGKWEFAYTATNFAHYFRDGAFNSIDSDYIWQGLHRKYYINDELNSGTYVRMLTDKNNRKFEWLLDYLIGGGYHQFTSFDFMDNALAGTREGGKIGLGITNPLTAPGGQTVEADFNGTATGPFFGCIFPDGYDSEDIAEYKVDRSYKVLSILADSGNTHTPLFSYAEKDGVKYKYFYEQGLTKTGRPFDNGELRNDYQDGFRVDNQIVPMLPSIDADTQRLSQLPADIATNAAPSGINGQPIKNIHYLDEAYLSYGNTKASLQDFFLRGQNWLYKKYDDGIQNIPKHLSNSAFDFKPRTPNKIMFRPLKAETYAQFAINEYDASAEPFTRQYFSQSIASRMNTKKRSASNISREREYLADFHFTETYGNTTPFSVAGMMGNISNIYNSFWGLQFNIDLPAVSGAAWKISPYAGFANGNNTQRFHHNAWGRAKNYWCHGGQAGVNNKYHTGVNPPWRGVGYEFEPAGAIGIIGAVATCTANTNIKFQTNNRLGCWSWSVVQMGAAAMSPTWGKGDSYRDLNTSNLFVKIYHQWPREQTIYDSRFFAVHHFNAGTMDGNLTNVIETKEENLTQTINGISKSYKYSVDVPRYDIDTRLPTCKPLNPSSTDTNRLIRLTEQTKVYGTKALMNNKPYDSVSKDKWNIETVRRAKLLPYRYAVPSVRIPKVKVTLPHYSNGIDAQGNELIYSNGGYAIKLTGNIITGTEFKETETIPFYDMSNNKIRTFDPFNISSEDIVMIIKNPGTKGYKQGDTFTCSDKLGAGLLITVTDVDIAGRISGLEVTEQGYDFSYSGFSAVDESRPISKTTTGIPIFTGGSQPTLGEGLSIHLVRGGVETVILADDKPLIATSSEYNLISMQSNKKDEDGGGSDNLGNRRSGSFFGLDSDKFELDVEISNPSQNNKYDLFFHFHNDISHTFMTQDWGDGVDRPPNDEQYIELTITTN